MLLLNSIVNKWRSPRLGQRWSGVYRLRTFPSPFPFLHFLLAIFLSFTCLFRPAAKRSPNPAIQDLGGRYKLLSGSVHSYGHKIIFGSSYILYPENMSGGNHFSSFVEPKSSYATVGRPEADYQLGKPYSASVMHFDKSLLFPLRREATPLFPQLRPQKYLWYILSPENMSGSNNFVFFCRIKSDDSRLLHTFSLRISMVPTTSAPPHGDSTVDNDYSQKCIGTGTASATFSKEGLYLQ